MRYVSGLLYEYYFICKRKAWLFSRGLSMEEDNVDVQIGKLIDENAYSRERKHILIDEAASIDFLKDQTVYEIKKSSKEMHAAIEQIKYYLFILKQKGVGALTGELRIPKENRIERIILTIDDEERLTQNIDELNSMLLKETPPPRLSDKKCRNCAYYELCFV